VHVSALIHHIGAHHCTAQMWRCNISVTDDLFSDRAASAGGGTRNEPTQDWRTHPCASKSHCFELLVPVVVAMEADLLEHAAETGLSPQDTQLPWQQQQLPALLPWSFVHSALYTPACKPAAVCMHPHAPSLHHARVLTHRHQGTPHARLQAHVPLPAASAACNGFELACTR
jgi:hypothetical protein